MLMPQLAMINVRNKMRGTAPTTAMKRIHVKEMGLSLARILVCSIQVCEFILSPVQLHNV